MENSKRAHFGTSSDTISAFCDSILTNIGSFVRSLLLHSDCIAWCLFTLIHWTHSSSNINWKCALTYELKSTLKTFSSIFQIQFSLNKFQEEGEKQLEIQSRASPPAHRIALSCTLNFEFFFNSTFALWKSKIYYFFSFLVSVWCSRMLDLM